METSCNVLSYCFTFIVNFNYYVDYIIIIIWIFHKILLPLFFRPIIIIVVLHFYYGYGLNAFSVNSYSSSFRASTFTSARFIIIWLICIINEIPKIFQDNSQKCLLFRGIWQHFYSVYYVFKYEKFTYPLLWLVPTVCHLTSFCVIMFINRTYLWVIVAESEITTAAEGLENIRSPYLKHTLNQSRECIINRTGDIEFLRKGFYLEKKARIKIRKRTQPRKK